MLVGMLSQSCHHWLHPCSNLAWTIGQNHNIELIVIDCCRQLCCSIVVGAVRWTCDCCFYYYSAFFSPSCPPPTFCSRTQRSRGRMCNQKLFADFMHHYSWYQRANLMWLKRNKRSNTSSLHKQTRIAQNQEFFPLGQWHHHWKLKIVFCAKSTTTTPWSTSLRAQRTIFVASFKDFARMGMKLGFWFCIYCIAKKLQKNPKHNNKSMSTSFQQVRVGLLIITWSLWSIVHGSSLSKSLLLEGRDLLRRSSSFGRLRKRRPVHCRSADGVWHARVQWHCAWCSSTMAMP